MTAFPDITPAIRAAAPALRGRLLANPSLADLTWFRVGGPAQVLFTPADEEDLAHLLGALDPGNSGHRDRPRLEPDRPRRWHSRRHDPARRQGLRVRGDRRRDPAGRDRGAGHAPRQGGGGGVPRRIGLLPGHSRLHRRRAAHECRRAWRGDHRRAGGGARHRPLGSAAVLHPCGNGLHLPSQRLARGRDLHECAVPGPSRRPPRHRSGNGPRQPPRARRPSRSASAPAARPSRTRRAARRGSSSMRPAAVGSPWVAPRSRRCTATS